MPEQTSEKCAICEAMSGVEGMKIRDGKEEKGGEKTCGGIKIEEGEREGKGKDGGEKD